MANSCEVVRTASTDLCELTPRSGRLRDWKSLALLATKLLPQKKSRVQLPSQRMMLHLRRLALLSKPSSAFADSSVLTHKSTSNSRLKGSAQGRTEKTMSHAAQRCRWARRWRRALRPCPMAKDRAAATPQKSAEPFSACAASVRSSGYRRPAEPL